MGDQSRTRSRAAGGSLSTTLGVLAVAFAKVRLGTNMFRLSPFMHGVLGLPMGFMLVFRWNNAHERWWYGRTCLGNILFYCKISAGRFARGWRRMIPCSPREC